MRILLLTITLLCFVLDSSQAQNPVMSTKASDRDISASKRKAASEGTLFTNYPAENIGPTVMSGRITDIDINPNKPTEFYVAYASGGLWYTNNNGTTFTPKFDNEAIMTIGDIAVDWSTNIVYIGSGEVNSSRSSYAGNGIYKSIDSCKTWSHVGLPESHHIGRIIIDQSNSQRIIVAALGHLYSPNVERGLFVSEDEGNTWTQTLFVNENTGGVDLIQDDKNPNVLYAALWQRERRAWNFIESGERSGIYKTIDGGLTWTLLTRADSGFPTGEGVGRIGLSMAYDGDQSYLYAILDNYDRRPKTEADEKKGLAKLDFKDMSVDAFNQLKDEDVKSFLEDNGFPEKYSVDKVKEMIGSKEIEPNALYEYLENANALLFETNVIGAEVYLSKDGGTTFNKTHEGYIDGLFNSYGYYFGQIRTAPGDPSTVYIMGVPILRSDDHGANWKNVNGANVHVDHHALWINPEDTNHIINGNDGGINISYDKGESWIKCNSPSVGQFYYINVDNAKPYNVYAGAQDNGVWTGSHRYNKSVRWHQTGKYPYKSIMGGDGMQVQIDNRDNNTVYTGFQFGNYFRIDKKTGRRSYITPKHKLGDRPYRWNWQSPILLSSFNQDILYMGSNKLLRSMDQGETFTELSEDLTHGGQKGDVAYGTLVCIDESKETFGKLVVGSDDGRIHLTKNGGASWKEISNGLPQNMWVTRVVFSHEDDNVIIASLNGYRWDDFNSYLYKSTDNGATWDKAGLNLPAEPINVVKEDPSDPDLIYVGTDHGLYISIDGGFTFQRFAMDIPSVSVHDVVVQAREGHLLVGTHGRSIYKIDLTMVRAAKNTSSDVILFDIADKRYRSDWGKQYTIYSKVNESVSNLSVFAPVNGNGHLTVTRDEVEMYSQKVSLKKGINEIEYKLTSDAKSLTKWAKKANKDLKDDEKIKLKKGENGVQYLTPGEYKITITQGSKSSTKTLTIKE